MHLVILLVMLDRMRALPTMSVEPATRLRRLGEHRAGKHRRRERTEYKRHRDLLCSSFLFLYRERRARG
jgi:hypothetical protein